MSEHEQRDWQILAPVLLKLGWQMEALGACRLLQAGISGASIYLVQIAGTEAILKLTRADQGAHASARGSHEVAFYRQLAARIPLAVPHVLASCSDATCSAVLLQRYQPARAADQWTAADYCMAAHELGLLHATFWDVSRHPAPGPWFRADHQLIPAMQQARHAWELLAQQPQFASFLTPSRCAWVDRVGACLPALAALLHSIPRTLCHGDCTTHNVLRDMVGRLIWIDWQEVRLGCGPDDLAFLLQRATIDGAHVPYEAALESYYASLAARIPRPPAITHVRQVMAAADLWTRIIAWPTYLTQAPAAALAAQVHAIEQLVEQLQLLV